MFTYTVLWSIVTGFLLGDVPAINPMDLNTAINSRPRMMLHGHGTFASPMLLPTLPGQKQNWKSRLVSQ